MRTGDNVGTFSERIMLLEQAVGDGKITAGIVVHQPYAADEHVERHYRHPRGGGSRYIEDPFNADLTDNLRKIARHVITETGSDLQDAMKEIAQSFGSHLRDKAPVRSGTLRLSGNVYVDDSGARVWERKQTARYRSDKE